MENNLLDTPQWARLGQQNSGNKCPVEEANCRFLIKKSAEIIRESSKYTRPVADPGGGMGGSETSPTPTSPPVIRPDAYRLFETEMLTSTVQYITFKLADF